MDELKLLLEEGNIGFYSSCEAIQFFLYDKKNNKVYNLYTIYVFEDYDSTDAESKYIGNRIEVDKNYFVGMIQKRISIEDAKSVYSALLKHQCSKNEVTIDFKIDGVCCIGKIYKRLKQFVPPNDINSDIPLNRVLKNNYYNGTYILEYFDVEKKWLSSPIKEKIEDAIKQVSSNIPIHLDLLPDRIGNIVFQFPSLLINVVAQTESEYAENVKQLIPQEIQLQIKRDRRIKNSKLHVTVINELDGVITGAYIGEVSEETIYPTGLNSWDPTVITIYNDKGLLLYKKLLTILKGTASASVSPTGIFRVLPDNNVIELKDFRFYQPQIEYSFEKYVLERIKKERLDKLRAEKFFIQYGVEGKKESVTALEDIKELINQQNCKSIYLWDPFLKADDILNILFYCKYSSVEMKAISSGSIPPISNNNCDSNDSTDSTEEKESDSPETTKHEAWVNEQRKKLDDSDYNGLSLEFRCLFGNNGYKFHDRFIIIQYYNQPSRVWSLGTSVNSLGNTHHILQKVEHGQYIVDAFDMLWSELNNKQCLIWGCKNGKKFGNI